MDGSNVSVMVTVGQLTKQKVHNFVEYCKTNLDLPQEVIDKLVQLDNMGEVALLAALKSSTVAAPDSTNDAPNFSKAPNNSAMVYRDARIYSKVFTKCIGSHLLLR